jgi:hypothetical protein
MQPWAVADSDSSIVTQIQTYRTHDRIPKSELVPQCSECPLKFQSNQMVEQTPSSRPKSIRANELGTPLSMHGRTEKQTTHQSIRGLVVEQIKLK